MNDIVLDFDGTLVLENSSRLFENITYKYNDTMTRYFIYIIFFSSMSKIFNRIFRFVSIILLKEIDIRLYIYTYMSKKTITDNFEKIIDDVSSNLSLNKELYEKHKDKEITILSRGIVDIIERFSKHKNIKYNRIIGSKIELIGDKIHFNILSFEDKVKYLENFNNFIYYTDSMSEGKYICQKLKIDNMILNNKLFVIRYG